MRRSGFRLSERISQAPVQAPRDGGRADHIRPVPTIDWRRVDRDVILQSQFIRLNALYKIVDKDGRLVDFMMSPEQYDFFKNMHNKNIILKARQLGMTTVIQIFLLDTAIFQRNKSCGVIAHTKEDAEKFFNKKIKLAWEHFPPDLKRYLGVEAEQDAAGRLAFSTGSSISVGTSMRSDTLQYLHVSEFGKLCAKFPEKADEVVSGALNTVSADNWVTIESTGEGAHGHFYDMCQRARRLADGDAQLSPMDYKFFFYPWWTDTSYRLLTKQEEAEEDRVYFDELHRLSGIILDEPQRNWYIAKLAEQKERMWREYPSTPDESFRGVIDGAPLSRVMSHLRRRGHIRAVPWERAYPVNTFWDLGRNDKMAIWFHQRIGFEDRFIDYIEDNFRPLSDYANILNRKPYNYGTHHLPHDADVVELTQTDSLSRKEILQSLLPGDFIVVPRIGSEEEGVNMTRENMDQCYFDEVRCEQGIKCLEQVRYKYDDRLQEFQPNLMRNQWKHGYDAFAQFGHGYRHREGIVSSAEAQRQSSEWSRSSRGGRVQQPSRRTGVF